MYVRISNLRGNWPKFCQGRRSPWCQLGQSLTKPPFFIAVTDSRDWTELASFTSVLQLQYARKPHTSTEKQRQMKKHMHARTHARTHTHTHTDCTSPRTALLSVDLPLLRAELRNIDNSSSFECCPFVALLPSGIFSTASWQCKRQIKNNLLTQFKYTLIHRDHCNSNFLNFTQVMQC